MKHNSILIALAAVALLTACQKKESERDKVNGRTISSLEVSYEVNGQAVRSLSFSHDYNLCTLQVNLNNEGLHWDIESDRDWCVVVPGDHRGSGVVNLQIKSNESFDARDGDDAATLTFTAGDFRGFRMTVDQKAATFLFSQPYFVTGKAGAAPTVNVTTLASTDWDFESDVDWLTVTDGAASVIGEQKVKTLTLTAAENTEDSRLATVTLSSDGEKDYLRLWQFGTELNYEAGEIFFPKDEIASFNIVVPRNQIAKTNLPEFAIYRAIRVDDVLDRLTFSIADNLSDCGAPRHVPISFTLSNNTATNVALPTMTQDFKPAGGLMTAEGLKLFAQKVAAGEPTTDWQKDGWVTMLQDIDMNGVTDWQGIGTAAHPFTGKFDGKGFSILKLNAAHGLFNYCQGADASSTVIIKNVTLNDKCKFYCSMDDWENDACFGAIAAQAVNTQFIDCSSYADIDFEGNSSDDSPAFIGGILGKGGEGVSVQKCTFSNGKITFAASGEQAYVGGIAGYSPSAVGCTMNGNVTTTETFSDFYVAGITTLIDGNSDIFGNSFGGTVSVAGSSLDIFAGGLYAATKNGTERSFNAASDMSSLTGTVEVVSHKDDDTSMIYAGGFIGYVAPTSKLSFTGYDTAAKVIFDDSVWREAKCCALGGVIGGCSLDVKAKELTFENITINGGMVSFKFQQHPEVTASNRPEARKGYYGGIAGYCYAPTTFTGCHNRGEVGSIVSGSYWNACKKQESSLHYAGGIAGCIEGGNATLTSCTNESTVTNCFWVNQSYATCIGSNLGIHTGGILGGFQLPSGSFTLTMTSCDNTASVEGLRGAAGGIIGFCRNATITGCNNSGKAYASTTWTSNIAAHVGGIAGTVINTSLTECKAKTTLRSSRTGSSDYASSGGILGRAFGDDAITLLRCYYYGNSICIPANNGDLYPGGLVGSGTANTTMTDCQYGGSVTKRNKADNADDWTKVITTNNLDQYFSGNGTGTATGTQLSDGNFF
ncbi:MAG: hypothetical protein J6Y32_01080 [Bacteroidales bacterium]|nr:hypothetical protein [Bacteroidales bacterium]